MKTAPMHYYTLVSGVTPVVSPQGTDASLICMSAHKSYLLDGERSAEECVSYLQQRGLTTCLKSRVIHTDAHGHPAVEKIFDLPLDITKNNVIL